MKMLAGRQQWRDPPVCSFPVWESVSKRDLFYQVILVYAYTTGFTASSLILLILCVQSSVMAKLKVPGIRDQSGKEREEMERQKMSGWPLYLQQRLLCVHESLILP